ncbi:MAG: hypothetical protein IPJ88_04610 [Myxococcales bacterium]|nr:MAG: hypothetical protein IPJ88_04610 [Myxococcales bacterium]
MSLKVLIKRHLWQCHGFEGAKISVEDKLSTCSASTPFHDIVQRLWNLCHVLRDLAKLVESIDALDWYSAKSKRLIAAGKPPKVAITAASRKLFCIVNAMLRDDCSFRTMPAD